MRRFTFLFLSAAATLTLSAQNKIDFAGRTIISATNDIEIGARSGSQLRPITLPYEISPDQTYTAIVVFDGDDADLSGVDVISRRDNMAIVRVTARQMEQLAAMPQVAQLSVGNEVRMMMDNVRATTGVNEAQAGTDGLGGTKYTGQGVIVGLMDSGLDVNHVNFQTTDGTLRTKALWTINSNGNVTSYLTPEKIASFTTENSKESHGTHVLGIMAGSYNGTAQYAFINANGTLQTKKQGASKSNIPYYGVATEAELAVACGTFTGSNIEVGTENVINYAKSANKPCVVNLSIGNTYGPHDGTDATSKWLASLGKDAIICIAAGNDGQVPVYIGKTFADQPLRTFASGSASAEGMADFWGADDELFTVRFYAYNRTTGEEVYSYTLDKNLKGVTQTVAGSAYNAPGYIHDTQFDKAFGTQSALQFSSNIDPNNNRYNVSARLQLNGSSNNVVPAFEVVAKAGQHVDSYANGSLYFTALDTEGYTEGSPDCSINGMACGDNIIVVGSYTNVASWPTLGGLMSYRPAETAGAISSFSSYGATFDGRQLPDICAPGGSVIASYSKYYVESLKLDPAKGEYTGVYTGTKRKSYWGEMQGTSMASPVVAGIIATWLQADPSMTVNDVKDVIKRTATHDEFTAVEPERWGAGKINALAGLKDILGLSGISDIAADNSEAIVTSSDNRTFEVFVAGARRINARLFSLSGLCVAEATADGENATLDASPVAAGVYILKVDSGKNSETHKIVIR